MQNTLLAIAIFFLASCSAPKAILKSENLKPNCQCEGEGNYTIVLEAGMGNWSLFYQPIFQELKKNLRVCMIDRPGYEMDSVTLKTRDVKSIAIEFNQVLMENGIENNIVLVGHSLGGLHVRMYQSLFPEKVKGMILLDAAHPDQFKRLPNEFYQLKERQISSMDGVIKLAQKGYLSYSKSKIPTFGIPDSLLPNYYNVTTQPEYYYSLKMELVEFENNLNRIGKLHDLGDLPLLVIGSKNSMNKDILPGKAKDYPFTSHNQVWFELQKDLSKLSSNSAFVESTNNHYLIISDSKLIANEILSFVNTKLE